MMHAVRTRLAAACVAVAFSVTLTGCITINSGSAQPTEATASVDAPSASPAVDYSSALEQLSYAIGALAKSSQPNATAEDCSYTAFTANSMASATPAPQWQGTYERITANMRNVGRLCTIDPSSASARALAASTRPDVVDILNREKFHGLTDWE
ncbi:hypothetical protein EDF63_0531 [Curtobacterium sp. JUb34]|nr:hypothetical protein EDF63_0531 [Curtobacterium sp. JUb34]